MNKNNRCKKILFCIPSLIMGGAEKVLVSIINELGKTGKYDITIMNYQRSDHMFLYSQIKTPIHYYYFDLNSEKPKTFWAKKIWKVRRCKFINGILKKSDVVVDFLDGGFYRFIKEIPGKRIAWIHSAYPHFRDNIKKDFSNYDALICLSDSFKEEIEKDCPKMKRKVIRIYNPFDFESIHQLATSNDHMTHEDNVLLNRDYYVHVSRVAPDKDLTTLIKGYTAYVRKHKNASPLYIIGEGPLKSFYQDMIKELNMEQYILMLGQKNNPYPFMKKAKALILSSLAEGMSRVIIEAMICNTPIIAANAPSGVAEVLSNGKCGVLFQPGNETDLANALDIFEKDQTAVLNRLAYANKSLDRFKSEIIMPQIEKVLDHV